MAEDEARLGGRLMDYREVAAWAGVSVNLVRLWAQKGRLPKLRLGYKVVRFWPEDVRRFVESRRVGRST